jgi:hypothetical protein
MTSWIEKLQQAKVALAERDADPLRGVVAAAVRGMESVSTNALLTLIGLPGSTGNARRIAPLMVALGFVPIKSRRLMPGGYRDTVTRGWARPLCELRNSTAVTKRKARLPVIRQAGEHECRCN